MRQDNPNNNYNGINTQESTFLNRYDERLEFSVKISMHKHADSTLQMNR